jgi:hypothetical protein
VSVSVGVKVLVEDDLAAVGDRSGVPALARIPVESLAPVIWIVP